MNAPTLRPYQQDALTAIAEARAAGHTRVLIKKPTGTGKTVMFAAMLGHTALAQWLNRLDRKGAVMLVIAHREELLDQAADKIRAGNPGLQVSIEQGDRQANPYSDVVIASIQTLAAVRFRRLHRLLQRHRFRIVVIDECFPPTTRVNGRRIDTIRVGDTVTAFDTITGRIAGRRVKRVLWKTATALIRLTTTHGELVCTPTHKLWTPHGWVLAARAMGCMIGHHAAANSDRVPCVPDSAHADREASDRHVAAVGPDVLLDHAPGYVGQRGVVEADVGDEPAARLSAHEGAKPHETCRVEGQDAPDTQGETASSIGARRERDTAADSPTALSRGVGLADGGRSPRGARIQAASLQARHREQGIKDRDRSGRLEPSRARPQSTGRAEGYISAWARVEDLEILQPGGNGEFERLCPGGRVYDLEVEDLHTYIADGFAVSNCHHAAAPTYRTALVHLGFLPPADASEGEEAEAAAFGDVAGMQQALSGWDAKASKDQLLVGVTATPNRSDAVGLGCVFQTIAYSYGLRSAISDGWLVPITPWVIETSESLDTVRTTHGDFNQRDLAETVNNPRRNQLAVESWKLHAEGRSTLAFTVDVAHARDLAAAFTSAGVRAAHVSGETPTDERHETLQRFRDGHLEVITNCMVLTEGVDLPLTACILHAKPTKSATLYEQMTGRGLRIHPGKTECVVLDLVDVARRHSLQSAPVLYGLPPGLVAKGTLQQTEDDLAALREAYPTFDVDGALKTQRWTVQELRDRASTFDIWAIPSLGPEGEGLTLSWIKSGEAYRLQYPWQDGYETMVVAPDLLGHFDLSLTLRPAGGLPGAPGAVRQRTVAAQVPTAREALVLAETFMRSARPGAVRLKQKDAPWKRERATDKQLARLARLRIPHDPAKLTKGGASDLLDLANARRGARG